MNTVKKLFQSSRLETEEYCRVDSYTTLCWIKNQRQWKQYVQSRVREIRMLTEPET